MDWVNQSHKKNTVIPSAGRASQVKSNILSWTYFIKFTLESMSYNFTDHIGVTNAFSFLVIFLIVIRYLNIYRSSSSTLLCFLRLSNLNALCILLAVGSRFSLALDQPQHIRSQAKGAKPWRRERQNTALTPHTMYMLPNRSVPVRLLYTIFVYHSSPVSYNTLYSFAFTRLHSTIFDCFRGGPRGTASVVACPAKAKSSSRRRKLVWDTTIPAYSGGLEGKDTDSGLTSRSWKACGVAAIAGEEWWDWVRWNSTFRASFMWTWWNCTWWDDRRRIWWILGKAGTSISFPLRTEWHSHVFQANNERTGEDYCHSIIVSRIQGPDSGWSGTHPIFYGDSNLFINVKGSLSFFAASL